MLEEDTHKSYNYSSLVFANLLNYESSQSLYFLHVKSLETIKIIAQLRLCNICNPRIIPSTNKNFKCRLNEFCFCCNTINIINHMLT